MSAKQYGFYIDSQRCTGCKTCELACKDYKDLTPDVSFRRIYEYCGGGWKQEGEVWTQDVFSYYLSISCNHCTDPACAKVCPSGAMHKREDGFIVVNQDVCIGCKYCSMACPYGAPQYNEEKGRMTKCDGCFERVEVGKKPMCVESCPLRALDLLPIDELKAKYGDLKDVTPLPPSHYTQPNIALRLNNNAKPTDDRSGFLANPKEV
ncbi:DMSO/selenate family reductase complex B subunit [Testudinibacter sp. P27/CKL/0425]